MKNILVATDHSNGAENAVLYAKQIAKAKSQKLVYLHVVNLPIVDPTLSASLLPDTIQSLKDDAEVTFRKKIEEDKLEGIQSDFIVSFNDILDAIEEVGENQDIDLVVIGRTGQRTFLDKILGSTANSLINNIKYPLLVVPEDYNGNIFNQLAYSSQFQYSENNFIAKTLEWKKTSDNKIWITHILEKFPLNTKPTEQFIASIQSNFNENDYEFKNYESDFFREGMEELINETGISLLFVTTHKKGFLEGIIEPSKTKSLINKSTIPLVIYSFEN